MIKFINKITGGVMMVADENAEMYKAAGHVPAAEAEEKTTAKTAAKKKTSKSEKKD
jgi:hypothetical protein